MFARLRFTVVLLLLITMLSGCGSTVQKSGDTLIYARSEDANTLDPIHTDIGEAVKVLVNIYDTLVAYDDVKAELQPSLAESWETSKDGRTWTFHLRPGVQFHDGTPLDADAVVFSFERLIQPEHPHVYELGRPYQSSFSMIDSVQAADSQSVVFQLKQPSAIFLQNLAMFPASIVSPTAVKKHQKKYGENPAGTGPFKLAKWNRDRQLVLQGFEKHWRGPPGVKQLIFLPIREGATRLQQLKRGEVHIADDLDHAELDKLAGQPDITVQNQIGMNVAYLTLQTEKPPLNQRSVRLAIARAIDKQKLARLVFAGHAVPAKTLIPPGVWGHHAAQSDHEFDPSAAQQLLAEAAKEASFELPLPLTLSIMSQSRPYLPEPASVAELIKDSLRPIGIEVTVIARDVNQHFPTLSRGDYELGLAGWSSDNADPDNFLYPMLHSDNISQDAAPDVGNNVPRFRHARFDELLIAAQRELDKDKRLALYLEAQMIVRDEAPVVPLTHSEVRVAQREVVQGYLLHPTGLIRLRLARLGATP